MRALVAGHICVDLVPTLNGDIALDAGRLEEVGPLALRAGGCVANTGVALADLGATVRVEALVGADPLGNWLTELIKPLVSAASQLRVRQGVDTSYSIALEPPGSDRMFLHHVGANAVFDGLGIDLRGEDILHLGYLTLLPGLWSDSAPLREILERAKAAGVTTSVDLAVVDRHSAWDWPQRLAGILPLVDIISPSVDDLASIYPTAPLQTQRNLDDMAAFLIDAGVAVCLITAGARGMILRTSGRERLGRAGKKLAEQGHGWADAAISRDSPLVEVVSTVGAGDAATAGLLYGVLAQESPQRAVDVATSAAAHRLAGSWRLPNYESLMARVA